MPRQVNDKEMISTVFIAKNVYGGDGLGRLGDGRVVFVPGAWAGEQVKAEIVLQKKSFVKARLVEVIEPSAERTEEGPTVPGMVYSGLSRAGEIAAKEGQLAEFFSRASLPFPLVEAPRTYGPWLNYRNKVIYRFQPGADSVPLTGYMLEHTNQVVDTPVDPLARPEINAVLPDIRNTIKTLLATGPRSIRREVVQKGCVTVRAAAKSPVRWYIGDIPGDAVLRESTAGLDFEVPASGFYQINRDVSDELARRTADEVRACSASDIVDLYCGVGVLGICAAKNADLPLYGIESGRKATQFAVRNAEANRLTKAKFRSCEVRSAVSRLRAGPGTFLIVDPPRGGLEKGVPEKLASSGAGWILYVSCDPATLVRDLKTIFRAYTVEKVTWLDMFPRTARFESMTLLKKK